MLEREDVLDYTKRKQELQVVAESLFDEMMADFDLAAFLADPRGYTRSFLATAAADSIRAVAPEAYQAGKALALKARAS